MRFNNADEAVNYLKGFTYGENTFWNFANEIIDSIKNFFYVDDNGFTKIVFIDKNKEYVCKFPKSKKFCGYDYCKDELDVAKLAKEFHVDEFFALTEQIAGVYVQPYVDDIGETPDDIYFSNIDSETVWECRRKVGEILTETNFRFASLTWGAYAIIYYGEQKFKKLINFLQENNINDLHSQNVGYIKGKPVLVDYSGYGKHSNMSWGKTTPSSLRSLSPIGSETTGDESSLTPPSLTSFYSRNSDWSF